MEQIIIPAREPLEATYTTAEVAEYYHVKPTTVRRWVGSGAMTAINVSRSNKGPFVFRKRDLEEFERQCEVRSNNGERENVSI